MNSNVGHGTPNKGARGQPATVPSAESGVRERDDEQHPRERLAGSHHFQANTRRRRTMPLHASARAWATNEPGEYSGRLG